MRTSLAICILGLLAGCQSTPYPQGERLYRTYCANCHMDDGSGLARLIPPLTASGDLGDITREACSIQYGAAGGSVVNGITYNEPMPSFRNLSAVEISNILNFLYSSWGNDLPPVNPQTVEEALKACASD